MAASITFIVIGWHGTLDWKSGFLLGSHHHLGRPQHTVVVHETLFEHLDDGPWFVALGGLLAQSLELFWRDARLGHGIPIGSFFVHGSPPRAKMRLGWLPRLDHSSALSFLPLNSSFIFSKKLLRSGDTCFLSISAN